MASYSFGHSTENSQQQKQQKQPAAEDEDDVRCDWAVCSPASCQPLAIPACLLLWLCLCSYAQGMLLNGFLNSVLTSIERRFDLRSVETGMIASTYDIGACAAIVPITYFGRKYRRSRFISVGALLVGVGSFVFSLPHFLAGSYEYEAPIAPLCYPDSPEYPDLCTKQSQSHYKWLFWLAQLLHGVGAAPFFTLAVAYLDDNITLEQSGVFLGIYYVIGLVGPASGYLLGGVFLQVYVDIGQVPEGLSPDNRSLWVGAWWVGFLISGCLSLASAAPMFGFPRSFRGSAAARAQRRDESHGDSAQRSADLRVTLADLLPSARLLLSIPTFVCLTLAGTAATVLVTSLATFGPKLMQHFFHLGASAATMSIGLVSVPCGAVGLLAGAAFTRCLQPTLRRLLQVNVVASSLAFLLVGAFFVRCGEQPFAGVNHELGSGVSASAVNFSFACNAGCNCDSSSLMFAPVCDAAGVMHFSPCYAGCGRNASAIFLAQKRYYTDCACVKATMVVKDANNKSHNVSAFDGNCEPNDCHSAPLFLTLLGFFMFFMFFIMIPTLQATIRVIPSDLKDFGIGIQIVVMRLLGSVPAPLLLGRLIDTTCSLWSESCDTTGACLAYNSHSLWLLVLIFIASLKLLEVTLFSSAALLYRPAEKPNNVFFIDMQPRSTAAEAKS